MENDWGAIHIYTGGNHIGCIGHCPLQPPLHPIHHSQQSYCLWHMYNEKVGWGPYLSPGNCIRILWQKKKKCISNLVHKSVNGIIMDSAHINNWSHRFLHSWKKCIRIGVLLMYSYSTVQKLQVFWHHSTGTLVRCSCLLINDFAVQAEMVAVETSIDVGNILWIFYDCL